MSCEASDLTRLEWAPHRVFLEEGDHGILRPSGGNELIDAPWKPTETYWCHSCDCELESTDEAARHVGLLEEGT